MRLSFRIALLSLATSALLAACQREDTALPVPAAATIAPPAIATLPSPATVADPVGTSTAPAPGEHTTFDAKAFAGTYSDDNMEIAFAADGTYTLSSLAANASTGTWTLEPDGHSIRLDPNAKSENDRLYAILDNDTLRASAGTQELRRAGAAR